MVSKQVIFVADDEQAVRETLSLVLSQAGFAVQAFGDGEALLSAARQEAPACILLDVVLPGRSGLQILKDLSADDYPAPIFMISGRGDIPTAVEAIRAGALDFIEKPFRSGEIITRIRTAIAAFADTEKGDDAKGDFPGSNLLTKREREVLNLIVGGSSNKEAGRTLGISPRTMEDHRANIMRKLSAKNAADLVRIVHLRPSAVERRS